MIDRYIEPETGDIWSEISTLERWLDVELAVVDAHFRFGTFPDMEGEDSVWYHHHRPAIDEEWCGIWRGREAEVHHDVAAFVDIMHIWYDHHGQDSRPFHFGLTSSDVVDTALSMALVESGSVILNGIRRLRQELLDTGVKYMELPALGLTHGRPAELITFGRRFMLFESALQRCDEQMRSAVRRLRIAKISGAVGTHSTVSEQIEKFVAGRLGLSIAPASQVIGRDRHAQYVFACASTGAVLEAIATEIRLLAHYGVDEVAEGFGEQQKGSSAMPHKRNPITAEKICGIARLLRGYVVPALEDIALWHERDISHSSVERVILPDCTHLTYHALRQTTKMLSGLVVDEKKVRRHAKDPGVKTHAELLQRIAAGESRDDAYRSIQKGMDTAAR